MKQLVSDRGEEVHDPVKDKDCFELMQSYLQVIRNVAGNDHTVTCPL